MLFEKNFVIDGRKYHSAEIVAELLSASVFLQHSIDQPVTAFIVGPNGANAYFELFRVICEGSTIDAQASIIQFWFHDLDNFAILAFYL
jgi:hypothetical protein